MRRLVPFLVFAATAVVACGSDPASPKTDSQAEHCEGGAGGQGGVGSGGGKPAGNVICGDGVKGDLQCDDGNTEDGDGCSSECTIEAGYFCLPLKDEPTPCEAVVCGDGVATYEECDDGNTKDGDGCSSKCTVEAGYECSYTFYEGKLDGLQCIKSAGCGDGVRPGQKTILSPGLSTLGPGTAEECDDGNKNPGDGCSATCKVEPGYQCNSWEEPGLGCKLVECGDGSTDTCTTYNQCTATEKQAETCDDGNTENGDGCSSTCEIEPDSVCQNGKCAVAKCGDGTITFPLETCEDGNSEAGDGCSAACTVEPGFKCYFAWFDTERVVCVGGDCHAKDQLKPSAELQKCMLAQVDLSNADLHDADLRGANLYEADVSDASFENANLSGAQLSKVKLTGANLAGADLTNANLTGAQGAPADSSAKFENTTCPDGTVSSSGCVFSP